MPAEPIIWTDFRNTEAGDNPGDLRKISGVEGEYDADAVSTQQILSAITDAGISATLGDVSPVAIYFGLSHDNPDASFEGIDYCIGYHRVDFPVLEIYENGVLKFWTTIEIAPLVECYMLINADGAIEYYYEEGLLYTSLIAPTFPLFADASLASYGTLIWYAGIDVGVVAKIDHLPLLGVH